MAQFVSELQTNSLVICEPSVLKSRFLGPCMAVSWNPGIRFFVQPALPSHFCTAGVYPDGLGIVMDKKGLTFFCTIMLVYTWFIWLCIYFTYLLVKCSGKPSAKLERFLKTDKLNIKLCWFCLIATNQSLVFSPFIKKRGPFFPPASHLCWRASKASFFPL